MLKQFAQETNYFAFFDTVSNHYNSFIDKVIEHTQRYPFIPLLEDEFGTRQNSYNCIISSLMVGNFGIIFRNDKTNLADLYSVVTLRDELHHGYLYISDILERYKFYDQNRLKYRTFEDYYPQLLETFKTKID